MSDRVCPTPYPGGTCGCGCDCPTDEKAFHDMHHTRNRRDGFAAMEPYCRYCQPRYGVLAQPEKVEK